MDADGGMAPGGAASSGAAGAVTAGCSPVKRAPFIVIGAFFAFGILASDWTAAPAATWLWIASGAIFLAIISFSFRVPVLSTAAIMAGFLAAGGLNHYYHYFHLPADHLAHIATDDRVLVKVEAIVRTEPVTSTREPLSLADPRPEEPCYDTEWDAAVTAIFAGDEPRAASGRIRVKLTAQNPGVRYGDRVCLVGEMQAPAAPTNPAQFDYRNYLRRQGIRVVVYVSGPGGVDVVSQASGFARVVSDVRRHLVSLLRPRGSDRGGELLGAILLGAVEDLSPDVIASFQNSGAMHLLAVSGLNVGVIAATIWWIVLLLRMPPRMRGVIVIVGVVAYTLLAGARPPAVRSAVMIVLATMGGIVGRRQITINSIAFAAFVILAVSPCELFGIVFQLSFLAILGIFYFYTPISDLLHKLKFEIEDLQAQEERSRALRAWVGLKRYAIPAIGASLGATIGVVPLIAYTFNVVNLSGIVFNALFVPVALVVTVAGFLGMLVAVPASLFWGGAAFLSWPAAAGAVLLERLAWLTTLLPGSYYYASSPPGWFMLVYYGLLIAVLHREWLRLRPLRIAVAVLLVLNVLAFGSLGWGAQPRLRATFLDVRHGNCVFLQFPSGKTMLYDCGTRSPFFDVGAQVLAPALWERGIHRIDAIVVSHSDSDHINGLMSLIPRFRIGCVFVPPSFSEQAIGVLLLQALDERGIRHQGLTAGKTGGLGDARIEALSPPQTPEMKIAANPNDRSLVARVQCGEWSIMLSGDVQSSGINWMLASGEAVESKILLLPHHGASAADCLRLCQAVRPLVTVVSCDKDSAPDSMVAGLAEGAGTRVLRTGDRGAIELTVERGAPDYRVVEFASY